MRTERVGPEHLADAIERAARRAGWNFRDEPVRVANVGSCTVYVVPARVWTYRRIERQAQTWRAQA